MEQLHNIVVLFASSYIVVCLLGLQSQFVRDKQVAVSFATSLGIGICNVLQFKLAPNASLIESAFFVLGGACGIVSSIYLHTYIVKRKKHCFS